MKAALFDSNIVIDVTAGYPKAIEEVRRYEHMSISIVTWIEVMASSKADDESVLRRALADFDIVELTLDIAERAAMIRRGRRLKLPDAVIQATAEACDLILVTRDTRAFPADMAGVRVPCQF